MMLKASIAALLIVSSISFASSVINYCGQGLCNLTGYRHITCDATGDFLTSCPSDARVVPMSDDYQQKILEIHNSYRNKLASGDEPGFNSATRMNTVVSLMSKAVLLDFSKFISLMVRDGTKSWLITLS